MAGSIETMRWSPSLGDEEPFDIHVYIPERLAQRIVEFPDSDAVAAAERALAAVGTDQESPRDVATTLLRSEGIASSRIEGLFLSTRRLFEASHAPDAVEERTAEQVLANVAIMEEVLSGSSEGVTEQAIRSWHLRLLGPDSSAVLEPGRWRTRQNWIGGSAMSPRGAEFIPPPPDLVPDLMADLSAYSNRVDIGAIVQAGTAHAQFETIHPFTDGNGRVGRALIYRILASRGLIGSIAPPLSPILVERRDEYIAGLNAYRSGDFGRWIRFFSDVVVESTHYVRLLAAKLSSLQASWEQALRDVRTDALAHRLVADLVSAPVVDRAHVAARYGVSGESATRALRQLRDRGIVEERPLRRARRGRPGQVYEAVEVFSILDSGPAQLA